MDIITRLHDLRSREHLCTVDLIEALVECDRTRAYLDHGHDTLWNFLVDALQYSKAAASRRFKAMKCARKFPAVIAALREQRVTLSSLEAIEPLLDEIDAETALFDRIAGKSFAQVKEDVARERPTAPKGELVRREFVKTEAPKEVDLFAASVEVEGAAALVQAPTVDHDPDPTPPPAVQEQVLVTLRLTPEQFALIEHARAIASRKPGRVPTVREAIVEAARFYVEKRGPKERESAKAAAASTDSPRTRHIPAAVRDAVMLRDGEQCTFVATNGRRCPATLDLHIDHIDPFAFGGTHEPENLRVLCGAHNRRRAEQTFGPWRGGSSGAEAGAAEWGEDRSEVVASCRSLTRG